MEAGLPADLPRLTRDRPPPPPRAAPVGAGVPADLPRLTRDRPAPPAGVVHLGVGAFFKAFGAIWLEDAMAASGGDWGVIGVSLRRPDERDKLAPQGAASHAAGAA